ncbi:SDR family oxidoreductase [Pelagicoccus sp. SDUM812002]|uniref:SDR family oxidoreductase n=1 Tax=Pelagicoccus sp. SDUM812002 TaxID=3041266 RepID=UPI00280FD4E2|nr:SDR family oxidoreductase [Pelagicoccus sp. SDUM812002]MDQ8187423.1 SDR family oxidoreductase [Pelagicoccus sp. SDUM812002]
MNPIAQKVVLITGASSGIGEATARHLAAEGAKVVVGARRTERLERLVAEIRSAGGIADFHTLDVTSLESMRAIAAFALELYGRIDVWVNNAGVMPLSPMAELRVDEWNRMIDVNLRGVLHGIAAVLPHFADRKEGQIVNVSSIAGHHVWPSCAVYSGTKFAVRAISEGLRQESKDIRVTIISPGAVESELADSITSPATAAAVAEHFRQDMLAPDAVARSVAYAIEQPADVDVNEITIRPVRSFN